MIYIALTHCYKLQLASIKIKVALWI